MHEHFENNDASILSSNYDIAQSGFALQQYHRAIGCLIKPDAAGGQQASDTSLVASIFFACFEVYYANITFYTSSITQGRNARVSSLICFQTLRGHYRSAISHVQNGVKKRSSAKESISPQVTHSPCLIPSPVSCVSLEALKVIFARLDYQSNQVVSLQLQRYSRSM